ncbi:histidine--tRNA ligase [Candidatus Pacearchaeota archaeon]|nr:histidine--tRNA ligase [Candidatus Pacearchaeota archaeon]
MKEIVKGFRDIEGEEAEKRLEIQKILISEFKKYGFEYIETPIIEYEEFVKSGNENDEAVSDIFKLKDRGERKLALRYEFTFQLKRIAQGKKLPYKRFQIGPVFRDEPISETRFRQFTQCDIDIIGSSLKDEAEILALTNSILKKLGVKFSICFNNRKLLNEIIDSLNISSNNRDQVIREIDKLDKLPESEIKNNLKKYKAEKLISILKNKKDYFKRFSFYKEIEELEKYCKLYGIKIEFSPFLARGLSYYNGSIFEIKSDIKETICAGGSYSVNGVQSTGISFGLDRLALVSKLNPENKKLLIISLDQDKEAIKLAEKLRKEDINCIILYGKPSKALDYANSKDINYVVFVGEKEIKSKKFKLKDMKTGKEINLGEKDLVKRLV